MPPPLYINFADGACRNDVSNHLEHVHGVITRHTPVFSTAHLPVQHFVYHNAGLPIPTRRNYHLNGLVRVHGVITRRTSVFPQLRVVKFDCNKCGYLLGPFTQVGLIGGCEFKPVFPMCSLIEPRPLFCHIRVHFQLVLTALTTLSHP
jgi:hypothetical protein